MAGDRITGTLSGERRTGSALPVWTLDATIKDGRITGTATAPAADRLPAVKSRVAGYVDAPDRRGVDDRVRHVVDRWRQRCQVGGRRGRLPPFFHRAPAPRPIDRQGGLCRRRRRRQQRARLQAEKCQGSPESFTADIACLADDGKTPIQIGLKGGRIGRGGIVEATIQSAAGGVKEWKGAATVWAWPDAPGFTGGREQDLEKWQYTAQPDPALVGAAIYRQRLAGHSTFMQALGINFHRAPEDGLGINLGHGGHGFDGRIINLRNLM